MNKPISVIINETKVKLANVCNESGLSPTVLDLIVQGLYFEIHNLAEKQVLEEEKAYMIAMNNKSSSKEDVNIEQD